MGKFYLTTAIPYVNAKPHLGHTLEYVQADTINRYHRLIGDEVYFVSGADENALKNTRAARKEGLELSVFLDKYSDIFANFYKLLGVTLSEFRRGTDKNFHWKGVQKLWRMAEKNGDIYKKKYKGYYCVGCASFKTEKDLIDAKCPDHNKKPELVEEENYFFRLSRYQDRLIDVIETGKVEVIPEKRKKEVLAFIKSGLEDFSISRSKSRAEGIGIPVPGDETQKIYVWFDALTIYMSGVGFGYDDEKWKKWWPADLHIIGKDIIRFHTVYWLAMLMSAKIDLPKKILAHGFVTSKGRKMSKSIGNVIDPYEIIDKYGVEAVRYYLLSQINTQDDGDFTIKRFEEVYQSNLANGLGNLVARVAAMASGDDWKFEGEKIKISKEVRKKIEVYELDKALEIIWRRIHNADVFINNKEVWGLKGEKKRDALSVLVTEIRQIGVDLQVFLPRTAEEILMRFKGSKINKGSALFPRLN